jgi:DNA-damage-inducible protein J
MPKDATINARVDRRLKDEAEKVLAEVGVTTSELITTLLRQIVMQKRIPFEVKVPNAETRAAMTELEAGGGERFSGPTSEVFDAIVGKSKRRRT